MDVIWELPTVKRDRIASVKEKGIPFLLIVGLGLIVVAYTTLSTVLFGAAVFILRPLVGVFAPLFLRTFQVILSLGLGTMLFAIIFKTLPETRVRWSDVWMGAALTAFIFTILNYLFGVYLSLFKVTTLAGTAGALMVLFLWIYIMNLFILFGAQFSKVYSENHGSHAREIVVTPRERRIERLEIKSDFKVNVS